MCISLDEQVAASGTLMGAGTHVAPHYLNHSSHDLLVGLNNLHASGMSLEDRSALLPVLGPQHRSGVAKFVEGVLHPTTFERWVPYQYH